MLFEIEHLTLYRYSVPIRPGEHLLRFQPLQTQTQQPLDYELTIDPAPAGRQPHRDAWGNSVERLWFQGQTNQLQVLARLRVQTREPLPPPSDIPLPLHGLSDTIEVSPYLTPLESPQVMQAFVGPLSGADGTLGFLQRLNGAIHGFYHRGVRLDGPPRSPAETLQRAEGVCRDLAVLFMAACRHAGIPARFVSGYQQGEGTRERRYLHAWPEALLPGYGWCGFDPTHGSRVGSDHVAVAAAPDAAAVNPLEGGYSFDGPQLDSTLDTEILITTR
jgi:transglutaminase-like putative cysteine protease